MILSTGTSLRSLGTLDLFDACYALMVEQAKTTKEEAEVIEKLDRRISDAQYESETGMPAITKWMQPANAADLPPGLAMMPEELNGGS